jgi:precorrin-6B methylase 1
VPRGSLIVVGTGIRAGLQLTDEARAAIESADEVLFLVAEPVAAGVVRWLNPRARTLDHLYEPGVDRQRIYDAMVEEIMVPVRSGLSVCAAFYGHPGVFGTPGHAAVRQARAEGFDARMLPGVSAEDCLLADLGVDPGTSGCLSYEATDFLARQPPVDTGAVLVLWQVSVLGRSDSIDEPDVTRLPLLVERLLELYPPEHVAIAYEASPYPVGDAVVLRLPLASLTRSELPRMATIVLEPLAQPLEASAEARSSDARTPAAATTLPLAE